MDMMVNVGGEGLATLDTYIGSPLTLLEYLDGFLKLSSANLVDADRHPQKTYPYLLTSLFKNFPHLFLFGVDSVLRLLKSK